MKIKTTHVAVCALVVLVLFGISYTLAKLPSYHQSVRTLQASGLIKKGPAYRLSEAKELQLTSLYVPLNHTITEAEIAEIAKLQDLSRFSAKSFECENMPLLFAALAKLPKLDDLAISSKEVNDELLLQLPKQQLKRLSLYGCKVTGTALDSFYNIEDIDLSGSLIDDESCKAIAKLKKLKYIDLYHTKVSDQGLAEFRENDSIQSFRACMCLDEENRFFSHITDTGLTHLTSIPNLKSINLHGYDIQGREIEKLSALSGLRVLKLRNCNLDDQACLLYTSPSPRD